MASAGGFTAIAELTGTRAGTVMERENWVAREKKAHDCKILTRGYFS